MKNRILSLALCLALCLSFVLPAAQVSAAEGDNGMVINKTATANDDGSYTIMLEAYATGAKIITETSKDVPTDIVLVLDQSGSMEQDIGSVSYNQYSTKTNESHYENRHNGGNANLWYKIDDDTYASVSVGVSGLKESYDTYSGQRNSTYYTNQANLYIKVGDEYVRVSVTQPSWNNDYNYTYVINGNTTVAEGGYSQYETNISFINGYSGPFYRLVADNSNAVYTYTYTDTNGVTQTIGTSTRGSTQFTTTLYRRSVSSNGGGSRLEALKTAVRTFTNAVAEKARGADGEYNTTDDIKHRIAMVGFAATAVGNPGNYTNTELFIGSNQYNFNVNAASYYNRAFQDMTTTTGRTNITNSINAIAASGGTHPNHGLEMANGIFGQYPVAAGERNRVLVVFTDGVPGRSDFDDSVATKAIDQATISKNTYNATVYTVGVFSGADATSAGDSDGTETEKANWFMQTMSSNNGTPQSPSYYLSAGDAETLNNIFQQISDQIESGGTSVTLKEEAIVKDIIAPEFTLPANATAAAITLETWHCTGKSGDEYTWTKNGDAMGAEATVKGNDVSVSGFNFADNYVGPVTEGGVVTGYRGNKLVIKFTVSPKDGYLGGNNVYTNASAGIYENEDATEPLLVFNRPQVNVPIDPVVVAEVTDQNVYLNETLTGAELIAGTKVTVGNVNLDFSKENYGLEAWQNDDVNIEVTYTDKAGNEVTSFENLKADNEYTVTVTVSPKEDPVTDEGTPATTKSNYDSGLINVYMPTITFKDSAINAGTAPVYETENFVGVKWMHGDVEATADMGTAPVLTYEYAPGAAVLTAESEVQVSVKMGDEDVTPYVNFMRNACDDCGYAGASVNAKDPNRVNFVVHINTFDLTITKSGVDVNKDGLAPFVFNVKGGDINMDVVIYGNNSVTIKGLPAGTYTVKEVNGYWRYEIAKNDTAEKTVTPSGATASVVFENARTEDKWLDDWAKATNNFG